MFASFTSILSPAIKEKLGLGPKTKRATSPTNGNRRNLTPSRPISLPGNRKITPLSASLQTEVQSPGFSSRLTSYVREEEENHSSLTNSPIRSRLGLPVVSLTKRTLPKLTSRNSCKFGRGRGEGHVPVMVKVAPQEPYSPFKRYSSPSERNEHQVRTPREEHNSSSDPRQVIAVLAELSGNLHC